MKVEGFVVNKAEWKFS